MHKPLLGLAACALSLASLGCSSMRTAEIDTPEKKAVMATVHLFVDSFNAGDMEKAQSTCADEISIIDEVPPYEWHGAGALMKWLGDYGADAKQKGITDGAVTCGAPRHVLVQGDRAYVVIPSAYAWKEHGKSMEDEGAMFAVALRKSGSAWRITGWSWAKP